MSGKMLVTAAVFSKSSFLTSWLTKHRPSNIANLSLNGSTNVSRKTLEERVGLPMRPKKPLTPYFRFMREMRPKFAAENPEYTNTEIVRSIAKQWVSASDSLKERMQKEYKNEQAQYVEKRAKYDSTITDEQRAEMKQIKQEALEAKERKNLRIRVKELGRPKKPASAFLRFISAQRTENPQLPKQSYREWHQKVTANWSRFSDADKEVYMKAARKEFEQYKTDIEIWEQKMIKQGNMDVVRQSNLIDPPEPKPKNKSS